MGKLLTQEEVDALLKGLSDGEIETEASAETDDPGITPYDFVRRDRLINAHMQTMEIVNEKFARAAATSLFGFMGRALEISVDSFEILKYGEFVRKLPERASFNVYRMDPLRGSCLYFFEAKLISLVVDILFGGSGKLPVEMQGRDFTTMEYRVIQRLLNLFFRDMEKAWSLLGKMSCQSLRSETNPQFVNIVSASDIVLATVFQVDLELDQAAMGYCVPFAAIEPIKEQLYGRPSTDHQEVDQAWREKIADHLRAVSVDMSAELGTSEITLRELLDLKEEDIVYMNVGPKDPMVLKVQEIRKGTCVAGQRNGNYAIEVLSMDETRSKEKRRGSARGTERHRDPGGDPIDRNIFKESPRSETRGSPPA
jgi:flagellar motor switch protein FliM